MADTHRSSPSIDDILARGARCLWSIDLEPGGQLTAYATKAGLVVFQDFKDGGWLMLTECPSNDRPENIIELGAMVAGRASHRGKGEIIDLDPHLRPE